MQACKQVLLVIAVKPASVIWRASKFSDLMEVNPASFLKPPSVTDVNERLILSKLHKPDNDIYHNQVSHVIVI